MNKKTEVVYAPLTACPDCGGMRCAVLGVIRKHPEGGDGNLIITTLIGIVAEVLSALPARLDDESTRVVNAIFAERLGDLRAMPRAEGESLHWSEPETKMVPLLMPTLTPAGAMMELASLVAELAEIIAANNWGSAKMHKAHQALQQATMLREKVAEMVLAERRTLS